MSSSREDSPDWLRCFQAPTQSVMTLSSGSESSPNDSPSREDKMDDKDPSSKETSQSTEKEENVEESSLKSPDKQAKVKESTPVKAKRTNDSSKKGNGSSQKAGKQEKIEKHVEPSLSKAQPVMTLSSGSESSANDSPSRGNRMDEKEPLKETSQFKEKEEDNEDSLLIKTLTAKSPVKKTKTEQKTPLKRKRTDSSKKSEKGSYTKAAKQEKTEKHIEPSATSNSVWALSSDSESPHNSPIREASNGKSPKKGLKVEEAVPTKKKKANDNSNRKGNDGEIEVAEEEVAEKNIEPRFSSTRLPLVLSEKVSRSKALVECEDESIDLSGDAGAVGRVIVSDNPAGNHELFLDLKGTMYKTTIVPSRTFCVVSFGPSEAKIEAIMNDFIQLKPQSNVYEAETMVEGTLEGFSFDSEDEADKVPKAGVNQTDQDGGDTEQPKVKTKAKAEKTSGPARKKGKAAGGKPPKKVKKKTQAPKRSKAKK